MASCGSRKLLQPACLASLCMCVLRRLLLLRMACSDAALRGMFAVHLQPAAPQAPQVYVTMRCTDGDRCVLSPCLVLSCHHSCVQAQSLLLCHGCLEQQPATPTIRWGREQVQGMSHGGTWWSGNLLCTSGRHRVCSVYNVATQGAGCGACDLLFTAPPQQMYPSANNGNGLGSVLACTCPGHDQRTMMECWVLRQDLLWWKPCSTCPVSV